MGFPWCSSNQACVSILNNHLSRQDADQVEESLLEPYAEFGGERHGSHQQDGCHVKESHLNPPGDGGGERHDGQQQHHVTVEEEEGVDTTCDTVVIGLSKAAKRRAKKERQKNRRYPLQQVKGVDDKVEGWLSMAAEERAGKDRCCSLQRVEGNEQGRKVVGQVDTGIRCEVAMCDFVTRLKPDAGGPIAMEHFQKRRFGNSPADGPRR